MVICQSLSSVFFSQKERYFSLIVLMSESLITFMDERFLVVFWLSNDLWLKNKILVNNLDLMVRSAAPDRRFSVPLQDSEVLWATSVLRPRWRFHQHLSRRRDSLLSKHADTHSAVVPAPSFPVIHQKSIHVAWCHPYQGNLFICSRYGWGVWVLHRHTRLFWQHSTPARFYQDPSSYRSNISLMPVSSNASILFEPWWVETTVVGIWGFTNNIELSFSDWKFGFAKVKVESFLTEKIYY